MMLFLGFWYYTILENVYFDFSYQKTTIANCLCYWSDMHNYFIFSFLSALLYLNALPANQLSAKSYPENARYQKKTALDFIESYPFKGNEVILDLGSGDGKISAMLAFKVPQGSVVSIDISDSVIEFSEKKYKAPNLHFQIANATDLPFQDQFDLVTSFTSMHLISNQRDVWACIMRCLKPKGKVLMQFLADDGFNGSLEETMSLARWKNSFKNFSSGWHFFSQNELSKFITKAGLKLDRIEYIQLDKIYPSKAAFEKSLRTWLPHLNALNESQKKEFLDDLINIYLSKQPLDDKGHVHYIVNQLEIIAEKPSE